MLLHGRRSTVSLYGNRCCTPNRCPDDKTRPLSLSALHSTLKHLGSLADITMPERGRRSQLNTLSPVSSAHRPEPFMRSAALAEMISLRDPLRYRDMSRKGPTPLPKRSGADANPLQTSQCPTLAFVQCAPSQKLCYLNPN